MRPKGEKKAPFLFAAVGAGAGVVLGVLLGSFGSGTISLGPRVGQAAWSFEVFEAQVTLQKLGFLAHAPTGQVDAATTEALKKFQATYGLLEKSGALGPETTSYLKLVSHQTPPQSFEKQAWYTPPVTSWT
jgi:peptidoglycan hydrolase-like protein with peptidoglycan-binding domain